MHDASSICSPRSRTHLSAHFLTSSPRWLCCPLLLLLPPSLWPYQPQGHIPSQTNRRAYGYLVWKTSPNQRRTHCEVGQAEMSRTFAQDGKITGRDAQSGAEKGRAICTDLPAQPWVSAGRSTRNQTENSSASSPDQASSFH